VPTVSHESYILYRYSPIRQSLRFCKMSYNTQTLEPNAFSPIDSLLTNADYVPEWIYFSDKLGDYDIKALYIYSFVM
jgi:hypothetical protein